MSALCTDRPASSFGGSWLARTLAIAASLALAAPLARADFTGKVVAADGDSITVLRDRDPVKVRVADIDAPEKAPPFGNRSIGRHQAAAFTSTLLHSPLCLPNPTPRHPRWGMVVRDGRA